MADIEANNWNEADSSNTTAAPDGAPEGMAPSGVNDVIRAIMGAVKRSLNRSNPRLTAGTGTAYTLSYGVPPGALVDGMSHLVEFHTTNGAGATLNVNLMGAIPLHYYAAGAWRVAPSGLLGANQIARVTYNAAAGTYRLMDVRNRTGAIEAFAGSTASEGTLLCYGQAVSRTDYVGLFATIGTAHGSGDGSTTFNLPDLRGRSPFGLDNMGGASANRLSSVLSSTTLGAVGGQQIETAGVSVSVFGSFSGSGVGSASGTAESSEADEDFDGFTPGGAPGVGPVHKHPVNINIPVSVGVSGSISGSGSGSTSSVSNVPPALVLNYVIRT